MYFFTQTDEVLIVDPIVKRKKPTPFGVDFYVGGEGGVAVAALPLVAAPPRTIACGYKNEIFSVFSTDFDNRNVFFT